MKKIVILASMLVMLFSFTLTANAEVSPEGTPVTVTTETTQNTEVVVVVPETNVSPKTGENQTALFLWGAAAVVLAAGAVATGKKARNA